MATLQLFRVVFQPEHHRGVNDFAAMRSSSEQSFCVFSHRLTSCQPLFSTRTDTEFVLTPFMMSDDRPSCTSVILLMSYFSMCPKFRITHSVSDGKLHDFSEHHSPTLIFESIKHDSSDKYKLSGGLFLTSLHFYQTQIVNFGRFIAVVYINK